MLKLLSLIPILLFSQLSQAANSSNTFISLNPGIYCYSLYQKGELPILELTIVASSAMCDQLDNKLSQETNIGINEKLPFSSSNNSMSIAIPLSEIQIMSSSSPDGTFSPPIVFMKKGVVKFFNDAKGKKIYVGNLPFSNENILILPPEIQSFVNEAKPQAPRDKNSVIFLIIIKEIQEGKKGLNAVNVKKA